MSSPSPAASKPSPKPPASERTSAGSIAAERRQLLDVPLEQQWTDRRSVQIVLGAIGVAIVLGGWELLVVTGKINELDVPRFSTVISEFWRLLGTNYLWSNVRATMSAAALGVAIAMVIGITVGTLMGASEGVRRSLRPTVEFLRPVPGLALLPLALVIWGPKGASDTALVAFGCTWVLLIQTLNGVHAVDEVALMTTRAFRLGPIERIRWLYLPGAMAYIATGLRICVSIALIIAIGAEILGGIPGLGNEIRVSQSELDLPRMYALVLASGCLGLAVTLIALRIERRVLHWHPSQRRNG